MPRSKKHSEQMRAHSREQILSAARKLFAEKGYDGCKVSDIAHQSAMSQGSIYWYFPSKEDLLKAVLAEGFENLGDLMVEAAAGSGDSIEKLDDLIARYIAFGRDGGGSEFITVLITINAHGGAERLRLLGFDMEQIGYGYHQSISAIIAQGQAEGVFINSVDPNLLATFFFSFFNGLMFTYGKEWTDISEGAIRDAIHRLLGTVVV
jgi:AcrR family transcriptional regulator